MSTTTSDPNTVQERLLKDLQHMVSGGLGEMSIVQALGLVFQTLANAERSAHLTNHGEDKGNGTYGRTVQLGSIPVAMEVPRTRSGEFRPALLPPPYQRGFDETQRELLMGLLSSSRSLNAVKASLKKMGLSHCEEDLEAISKEFLDEFELHNTRPIDTDMLTLYIDAKHVDVRVGDRLRSCSIYVVVGLSREGKKSILSCTIAQGGESLEAWKKVLRSLLERGLRRVLLIVQDDFPGLLAVSKGLFPQSDIQLCIVHMQRNAKNHFDKEQNREFQQRLCSLKNCWDWEKAKLQFEELCERFATASPHFIGELRKKRDHYLVFLSYPQIVCRSFSTTNAVEAVNGQLERLRRNTGGYFQGEEILKIKLASAIEFLESGSWRKAAASVRAALHDLNVKFTHRFESEPD